MRPRAQATNPLSPRKSDEERLSADTIHSARKSTAFFDSSEDASKPEAPKRRGSMSALWDSFVGRGDRADAEAVPPRTLRNLGTMDVVVDPLASAHSPNRSMRPRAQATNPLSPRKSDEERLSADNIYSARKSTAFFDTIEVESKPKASKRRGSMSALRDSFFGRGSRASLAQFKRPSIMFRMSEQPKPHPSELTDSFKSRKRFFLTQTLRQVTLVEEDVEVPGEEELEIYGVDIGSGASIQPQLKELRKRAQSRYSMRSGRFSVYEVHEEHPVYFIYFVMVTCVVYFICTMAVNDWQFEPLVDNPVIGPSSQTLLDCGAKQYNLMVEDGEWWRLISSMFMHGGIIHIMINMLSLRSLGMELENSYGSWKVAFVYLSSGIFGAIISSMFVPDVIGVGASGAIFGLLGATWAELFQDWEVIENQGLHVIVLTCTTGLNMIMGLMPFLDNFAHMGGLLFGFLTGCIVMIHRKTDRYGRPILLNSYHKVLQYGATLLSPILIISAWAILYSGTDVRGICGECYRFSCVELPPGSDDPWWSCHDCSVVGFSLNVVNDTVGVLECPYENSDTIIDDVTTLYPDIFVNSNTLDTEVALDICTDYCE